MNIRESYIGSFRPRRCSARATIQYGGAWLILVVVLSSLAAQEVGKPLPSGPRLEFESTEVELGTIDRGEVSTARFTVRNLGDQPLRIVRVKPG